MRHRTRLAALALGLPLALPLSAHAAMHANVCKPDAGSTVTSLSMVCNWVPENDDSGRYTIAISWPSSPCLTTGTLAGTPATGVASGTGPEGGFSNAPALALVYPTGQPNDLSIGFQAGTGDGTERHTAQLKFTCPTGAIQPDAHLWELDTTGVGNAANSAYCSYGNVTGPVTFNPPLGNGGYADYTMTLTLNCAGAAGAAGAYSVTVSGRDTGGCVTGGGSGTITGTGPGGGVNGAWMFDREGVHYFGFPPDGTGFIHMGGQTYGFYLWLDLVAAPGPACPVAAGTIVGHGIVMGI